nr:sugar phosphate isomerase/epimerase [Aestuariicella hydrocarbonica]
MELGAEAVSTVCLDFDQNRGFDQLAMLAQLVADRNMKLYLEFAPPHPINTLEKALRLIQEVEPGQIKLLIDTMHFFRSGATLSSLATIDPDLIGYVQLCDVAVNPTSDDYFQEACFDRRLPGEGVLPLQEFVKAISPALTVGLEVPIISRLANELDVRDMVREAVSAARKILI